MHSRVSVGGVRLWQKRLIFSIILCLPATGFLALDWLIPNSAINRTLQPWAPLATCMMSTLAIIYLGLVFWRSTIRGLKHQLFNVDSLITIGTSVAYAYSCISFVLLALQNNSLVVPAGRRVPLYFSTVTFLFVFVVLGKWLEMRAISRAQQSVKQLIRLKPSLAHVVSGGNVINIPVDRIEVGDRVIINPHERIPIDGYVVDGVSSVNEAIITGESAPVSKQLDSRVIGGTTNGSGELVIVADHLYEETLLAQIIQLIRSTRSDRTINEDIADRMSNVFVPLVILFALICFAVRYFFLGSDLSSAMTMFISIIMVACPYAFGLASPSVTTASVDLGTRNGILIKGSRSLESLSQVDTIVFDKTGTLTKGQLAVTDVVTISATAKETMSIASSLAKHSFHPLAQAIYQRSSKRQIETRAVKRLEVVTNRGISGLIGGKKYYLGSEEYARKLHKSGLPDTSKLRRMGKVICYVFTRQQILGVIGISDQPKEGAVGLIKQLHQLGIKTYLLSGDSETATKAIARRLGIKQIIANTKPDDKAKEVISLRQKGHVVAMVGDGINDAPALASASVGIAIGTGTEAAIETGDIVIVNGSPQLIYSALRLAKLTTHKIRQNIFFSLFYNVVSLPIAAGTLAGIGVELSPELASLIMAMSITTITVNSLTLRISDLNDERDLTSSVAPIILFMLFTVIYVIFLMAGTR